MFNLIVLGIWTIRERQGQVSNFPNLAIDYPPSPSMLSCSSVAQTAANMVPDPPLNTWAVVCSQVTLDAIEADNNYQVLSSEEIIDETI